LRPHRRQREAARDHSGRWTAASTEVIHLEKPIVSVRRPARDVDHSISNRRRSKQLRSRSRRCGFLCDVLKKLDRAAAYRTGCFRQPRVSLRPTGMISITFTLAIVIRKDATHP
jgi:hypothetical protein